eukprot:Clim_evm94s109 gene=Clim_evmTU94s109
MTQNAAAAEAVKQAPRILRPFVGNQRIFGNRAALAMENKVPALAYVNDVTNAAPGFKWALSIVPILQALQGQPPVENLDLKQSCALAFTGYVWSYYATIIKPQNAGSRALMACNLAMAAVHSYNIARKVNYMRAEGQL